MLQDRVAACIVEVANWMLANCLQLNTAKTEVIWFTTNLRQFQLPTSGLRVGDDVITPSRSVRDLGVFLDSELTMRTHVSRTVSRCFFAMRQLRSVRRSVPFDVFQSLIAWLQFSSPKGHWSERSLVQRITGPKGHQSEM